ncbi:metallophosphoesterase [Mucilaginibacter terrae]|uniref:metallophosphoesterase n=1 Tax=Mucilaginibacter terrae TaxID=1955052 RepID=UPI00363D340F
MSWTRRKFIKAVVAFSIIGVVLDSLLFEKFFIEVNEFNDVLSKPNTGIKILQVSDLHLNSLSFYHKWIIKKINKIRPDLIVITGDSIDKAKNMNLLNDFMQLIDTGIKKIAILGNWEYWGEVDLKDLKRVYNLHNCDLLINETKQYTFRGKTISVTGVDDYVGGKADIEDVVIKFKASDLHVVLNHCPEYSAVIPLQINKSIPVDLILSGHTHGGQVNIAGIIPFLPQGSGKFVKGWYKNKHMNLYVSKGIGTSLIPVRFGARAEIAIFNM